VEGAEAAEGDAAFGGVLKKKKKKSRRGGDEEEEEGEEEAGAAAAAVNGDGGKGSTVNALLDEYFGQEEEQLSETDRFLKKYLATQAWRKGGDGDEGSDGSDAEGEGLLGGGPVEMVDWEDEEQFLSQADKFEAAYNFRCALTACGLAFGVWVGWGGWGALARALGAVCCRFVCCPRFCTLLCSTTPTTKP